MNSLGLRSAGNCWKTPLLDLGLVDGIGPVWVKDESVGPTGTFKDRLAALAATVSKHPVLFGAISYGNTALSFSWLTYQTSNRFVWFYPRDLPSWILGPSTSGTRISGAALLALTQRLGAHQVPVDLEPRYLDSAALRELADNYLDREGRDFVNITEGLEQPAYEAILREAIAQAPTTPRVCIVQYGAGVLANEFANYSGESLPNAVVLPISTPNRESAARMLYGPHWLSVDELRRIGVARSLRHRQNPRLGPLNIYEITEPEIEAGLRAAQRANLSSEPSGAAGLGFLHRIPHLVPDYEAERDPVLVINTGNAIDAAHAICAGLRLRLEEEGL